MHLIALTRALPLYIIQIVSVGSYHAQHQGTVIETAKWNLAIVNIISFTCVKLARLDYLRKLAGGRAS